MSPSIIFKYLEHRSIDFEANRIAALLEDGFINFVGRTSQSALFLPRPGLNLGHFLNNEGKSNG